MKPTVSIIIATYNRALYIGPTIESFLKQKFPKDQYEIIVADNTSTDTTKAVIQQYTKNKAGVQVRYIYEGRPGNHFARNTAAQKAKYDILYFADDDVIADSNLLKEIIVPFRLDPEVATVTGRILPKWEIEPPKWVGKYLANSSLLSFELNGSARRLDYYSELEQNV